MNIVDLAILKKMVAGGGGSGTDNYNDLSNLPQINGETLAGNKTAENLGLQDALTFDSAPTEDSTNPVESGGVFNALAGKQDNLTFDDDPTENSTNPVKSGGVYSALAGKQDNLTFDGVYNASTNKAATESTVTNAIAGLDVSDFSVDADETISSISETDGKINVTKQDIAIASNQVTAMTGYTKPSSAPATPAIQTSDTANQAFGKLEFKADTNQTNILYALEVGAKNLFRWDKWVNDCTVVGGTKTISSGVMTLTSSSTNCYTEYEGSAYPDVEIPVKENEQYVMTWENWRISGASRGTVYVVFVGSTGAATASASAEVKKIEFTTPTGTTGLRVYIRQTANALIENYSDFMICSKAVWDTLGHDYQPPSVSNYELTKLQAEDRSNILYSLQTGVKNICNPDTWILGYYLKPEDGSLIPYPEDNGITSDFIPVDYSSEDYYYISGLQNDGNNLYNVIHAFNASKQFLGRTDGTLDTTRNVYESSFTGGTPVGTGDIAYIRITQYGTSGNVTNIDTSLVMVCTGHAKEQSAAHQPYALPNSELTKLESEDRAALVEVVDAGAKNKLKLEKDAIKSLNSGGSWSGYVYTPTTAPNLTVTINDDGTVTLNGSTSSSLVTVALERKASSGFQGYVLSGSTANTKLVYQLAVSPYTVYATADGVGSAVIANYTDGSTIQLSLQIAANSTFSNTVITPMICTLDEWKVSQNYAQFALPNTDLTRMMTPFFTVPINHNMIYRGQNLGDTLTADQDTALSSGNFTDLYLGDYWTKTVTIPAFYELTTAEPADWSTNYTSYYTKSGDTYTPVSGDTAPTWAANTYYERLVPAQTVTLKAVIADFDTFYAGYASSYAAINTHHAGVIVTGFNNVVWNKTNSTAGGYVNSLIHKWLVGSVLPQIETWFGSAKVLSHQKLLTNAITGDAASGWAWSSQKISLLSENQMYGSKVWGGSKATNGGYEPGEAFKHLNVFNHIDANLLFGNKNIWLRDIASAVWAASLSNDGIAYLSDASYTWIAPAALILLS